MNDVIESCKYHQHQDDSEADAKAHFLGPLRQRTPANTFYHIEQKVTAIEERDGKEVQKPDGNREHGRELNERDEAEAGDLSRHLRDANRAAELTGRFTAAQHPDDIVERAIDDGPSLLQTHPDGLRRGDRMQLQ